MNLFKSKKQRNILTMIKAGEFTLSEIKEMLSIMTIHDLRLIGKSIIYSDYDGYNGSSKYNELIYFDNLDRWQKEFFVDQRLYKIYKTA